MLFLCVFGVVHVFPLFLGWSIKCDFKGGHMFRGQIPLLPRAPAETALIELARALSGCGSALEPSQDVKLGFKIS